MELTGARSVYEVGCGPGWNLSAIRRACSDVAVYGWDVNRQALDQAYAAGIQLIHDPSRDETKYDLVFTAGVLIHQSPAELLDFMLAMVIAKSAQWVLAVEYAADVEVEIAYRGQPGLLWKRPYGNLYQNLGLTLVRERDAGPGFDRCTAWLMEISR